MKGYHFVGLDVHKKTIAYCLKEKDGTVLDRGTINATRSRTDSHFNYNVNP